MGFSEIKCHHFRNLKEGSISFRDKKNVFLVGPNGQGKTNILELIYYLSYGSSFRTKNDQLLIKHKEKDLYCSSLLLGKGGLSHSIDIKLENKNKRIRLNSKTIKDRKELLDLFPCIVFCHDDIAFINGQPEKKRWFFDQTISLKFPLYIDELRKYKSLLKQRNGVLKSRKLDLIEIYSVQMTQVGLSIQRMREKLIKTINPMLEKLFREISKTSSSLKISYQPSWKNINTEKDAFDLLQSKLPLEMEKGITLSGPHRDNYIFNLDKSNLQDCGSTGQMRLVSLLLRIIQSIYLTEKRDIKPVYLLDDVLLELDREKREDFLKHLPDYEQAFFTFLPGNDTYKNWDNSLTLEIKEGEAIEKIG